jgi:hypothetical protein
MPSQTVPNRRGEHLLSECPGGISRDDVVIAAGQVLVAGAVVGEVLATGEWAIHDPAASDGTQVAAGVLFDAVDASGAAAPGTVHNFGCELSAARLAWKAGLTDDQKSDALSDLAKLGVKAR